MGQKIRNFTRISAAKCHLDVLFIITISSRANKIFFFLLEKVRIKFGSVILFLFLFSINVWWHYGFFNIYIWLVLPIPMCKCRRSSVVFFSVLMLSIECGYMVLRLFWGLCVCVWTRRKFCGKIILVVSCSRDRTINWKWL